MASSDLIIGITVDKLIETPFSERTLENKIQIVSEGKPRPLLKISAITVSDKKHDGMETEVFDPSIYDQIPWLTGSETQQCLYCWACLLFAPEREEWKVAVLEFLANDLPRHESTVEHIQAALNLRTFTSENLKVVKETVDGEQFNQMVHRNREVIKVLINAVCSVVVRDQRPRGRNAGQSQISPESCVKVLNLLRVYNIRYDRIDDAIQTIKLSPELITDVVDSLRKVVNIAMKKDLQMSAYVSLTLSEHSTDRAKSQLSVILRHIKKGQVCERFLGFINILVEKSADVIYNLISSTVEELGISDKFVAFSFDGAVLELSELSDFMVVMEERYPHAYFVPSYLHGVRYSLQQSLSVHKALGSFFKMMKVMEAFFDKNQNDCGIITLSQQYSKFKNQKLNENFSFENFFNRFKIKIAETFEFVIKNCTKWSADDYIKSFGLLQFLEEFQTRFLCRALTDLFELIVPLDVDLKCGSPEKIFQSRFIIERFDQLEKNKTEKFQQQFNATIEEMNDTIERESKRSKLDYSNLQNDCYALYCIIVEHFILYIRSRFRNLYKLEFCSLIYQHVQDSLQQKCLGRSYLRLVTALGLDFDLEQLRNEVTVQQANEIIFKQKTAYDLLHFLEDPYLKSTFKYTQKLLEFTLVMPFMAPAHEDFSKLRKIEQFSYSTDSMLAPGDISVLHIEGKYLLELNSKALFLDEVIERFCEVNKSLELMYKKQD